MRFEGPGATRAFLPLRCRLRVDRRLLRALLQRRKQQVFTRRPDQASIPVEASFRMQAVPLLSGHGDVTAAVLAETRRQLAGEDRAHRAYEHRLGGVRRQHAAGRGAVARIAGALPFGMADEPDGVTPFMNQHGAFDLATPDPQRRRLVDLVGEDEYGRDDAALVAVDQRKVDLPAVDLRLTGHVEHPQQFALAPSPRIGVESMGQRPRFVFEVTWSRIPLGPRNRIVDPHVDLLAGRQQLAKSLQRLIESPRMYRGSLDDIDLDDEPIPQMVGQPKRIEVAGEFGTNGCAHRTELARLRARQEQHQGQDEQASPYKAARVHAWLWYLPRISGLHCALIRGEFAVRDRLRKTYHHYHFGLMFVSWVTVLLLYATLGTTPLWRMALAAAFTFAILVCLRATIDRKGVFSIALLLGLVGQALYLFGQVDGRPVLEICGMLLRILFQAVVIFSIGAAVVRSHRVTMNTIFGAACIYLMAALAFGDFYVVLDTIHHDSFSSADLSGASWVANFGSMPRDAELIYHSVVTLTTLGYGDIVPQSPPARYLSALEALLGQLYLTIIIARFVGLELHARHVGAVERERRREQGD